MPSMPLRPCSHPGCQVLVKSGTCPEHRHSYGYYPVLHRPLLIPVVMVIGAPASGKTTFVENNKKEGDMVLDLDVIKAELTDKPLYSWHDKYVLDKAIAYRNRAIEKLQYTKGDGETLWFVIGAPDSCDRQKWKDILRPSKVYVMQCSIDECLSRIKKRKSETEWDQMQAAERWFDAYEPMQNEIVV